MILIEYITPIALLLKNAALSNQTVSFVEFHSVFPKNTFRDNDKYDTLEAASRAMTEHGITIYSSLLSKKDTGCPGIGFFDVFRIKKREKYLELVGDVSITGLSIEEQLKITMYERKCVYQHAKSIWDFQEVG
ncbi:MULTISPECIES: hypothetical protein [Acinetobacter]|uniref:hypothetical protein n=1 Tax=Acinetobacter TaxID=469 RepID=UPI000CFEDC8D|nr:hypothetical protein [Acinetobacter sp. MYb10]QLD62284.1 hypothetical protein CQZ96_013855 [Acinetobacter sp. MYb10]